MLAYCTQGLPINARWYITLDKGKGKRKRTQQPNSHHSPVISPAEDLLEGSSEVIIEDGVYNGIEGTVAVAEPEEKLEKWFWHAFFAKRRQRVGEEKREPADDEHAYDHRQDEREALFPVLAALPPAGLGGLKDLALVAVPRFDLAPLSLSFGALLLEGARVGDLVVRGGRFLHVLIRFRVGIPIEFLIGIPLQIILLLAHFLYHPVPRWRSGSLLGDLVNSDIHEDHDDARQEKRANGRGNDVPFFFVDFAGVPLYLLHGYQRREGDHGGDDPNYKNNALDSLRCALEVVLDGLRDRPVPVQTDGAQVSDGGCAEENV